MFGSLAALAAKDSSVWEKIVAWYQNSLLHEILTYLNERYFTIEFGTYENFSIGYSTGATVRNIVLAIMLGLIAATVMMAYSRNHLGGFVRKLLKTESLSPETAKTLLELGYFRSTAIRRELSRGTILRMVVRRVGEEGSGTAVPESTAVPTANPAEEEPEKPAEPAEETAGDAEKSAEAAPKSAEKNAQVCKIDFLTARFYIPEELRYRAEVRFDKKGSGWLPVLLTAVVAVFLAAILCWLLPDLVRFADNLISWLAPK